MKIDSIYHRTPLTIKTTTTIREALEQMLKHGVNSLVVLDDNSMAGIITTEDIARTIVPDGFENNTGMADAMYKPHYFEERCVQLQNKPVNDVMRTDYLTVSPDTHIMTVAAHFLKNNLYVVPVFESNKLVGIVTRTQMLTAIAHSMKLEITKKT